MTYTEWTALPLERRNAMCSEAMGWFADWDIDTGQFCCWRDRAGREVAGDAWSPCTDRNHTAMMVETVSANANLVTLFNKHLSDVTDHWPLAPLFVLGIEPDKIAWAAWSALTNHVGEAADMVGTQIASKKEEN